MLKREVDLSLGLAVDLGSVTSDMALPVSTCRGAAYAGSGPPRGWDLGKSSMNLDSVAGFLKTMRTMVSDRWQ